MNRLSPEQVRIWKRVRDGEGGEASRRLVEGWLMTPEQKQWLARRGFSLDDLFSGKYRCDESQEVIDTFYRPWNDILEASGLKREFGDIDPRTGREVDTTGAMFASIQENLGPDIQISWE